MSELDRYLLYTENPEIVVRRHWASLAKVSLIFLGALAVSFLVLTIGASAAAVQSIGMIGILAALGWYAWKIGDWYVERFVITDKRVLLITGLLTKRVAIMPLSKVTDLTYERSVAGRVLGYGVFVMESAGQHQAFSRVDYLPSPDLLYHQVSMLLFGPRSDGDPNETAPGPVDSRFRTPDEGSRTPGARTARWAAGGQGRPALPEQATKPLPRIR